jgi:hypothetical protein
MWKSTLFLLVGILAAVAAPQRTFAETTPGGPGLSEAQQATLNAGLAEKTSYAALVRQALDAGMDCGDVVGYLCKKADNDASRVYGIVYAAITERCDASKIVSVALRGGAPLQAVVQAALAGIASREAITAGATEAGYTAAQISSAFGAGSGGGPLGGGSVFDGPIVSGPLGGSPVSGGAVGGGSGGSNASQYKRR